MTLGVFTVDGSLRVRTWDGWLAARTGIAAAEAHDRPLAELIPAIASRGLIARFEDVLATGQVQVLSPAFHRYLIPCPPVNPSTAFTEMQQRVTLGPLRDGSTIVGVLATIEDVTDRLEAEKRLADALRSEDPAVREAAARQLADAEHLQNPIALAHALRDGSWRVRRTAVEGLLHHADRATLVELLTALKSEHGDFNVLSSAIQLLAASEIDVTASLAALLTDPDPNLRMQAALALGQQEQAAAAEALIPLLQDPDVNVRFHAIEALGRLRAADAVDALADIAESGDFFLAFPAIDALARIRDPRVAGRLVRLLDSPELCDAAAEALGEVGEADVVAPLVSSLNAGCGTLAIIRAVGRLHERYERFGAGSYVAELFQQSLRPAGSQRVLDALSNARPDDVRGLVLVLGWLRGAAVERALTRLLGRPEVRPGVIEAIVRQGTGIVDLLIEQLDAAEDEDTRAAAITALARIGDHRAVPALVRALGSDERLVIAAAGALGSIGEPAAFEPLLRLVGHPNVAIRQAVVGALNSIGHPDMHRRVRALLDAGDAAARESAVRIAGYFGYADCLEPLLERSADPDENVRKAALEQLPHLDTPRAAALLAKALQQDTSRARAAAAQALGQLNDHGAVSLLLDATSDEDVWVRYFAVRALAKHGGQAAIDRLAQLSAADAAMPVRLAAIEALGAMTEPAVLDVLLARVHEDEPELCVAAVVALGGLDAERAVQTLLAAVRSDDPRRRLAAVKGLARRGDPARIEALRWTAIADPDPAVAAEAIQALATIAQTRDGAADDAIAALLALTVEPRCRESVLSALAHVRHRIPAVASGLRVSDPDVRVATVEALSRLHHGDASAAIRSALEDEAAAVRVAAVVALHRLGARGLSHVFAVMTREDPSRDVRRAAAAALAQDPRRTTDPDGRY